MTTAPASPAHQAPPIQHALDTVGAVTGTNDALVAGAEAGGLLSHRTAGLLARAGVATGMLGLPLGAYGVANGTRELLRHDGNRSQGALDVVSGTLGMASGVTGIVAGAGSVGAGFGTGGALGAMALAAPPLAIAAGVAGLAAYGNDHARDHGWYGEAEDRTNATFLGSVSNRAVAGWRGGQAAGTGLLGDNIVGRGLGYAAGAANGAWGAVGQTMVNTGAAVAAGGAQLAVGAGELLGGAGADRTPRAPQLGPPRPRVTGRMLPQERLDLND